MNFGPLSNAEVTACMKFPTERASSLNCRDSLLSVSQRKLTSSTILLWVAAQLFLRLRCLAANRLAVMRILLAAFLSGLGYNLLGSQRSRNVLARLRFTA